MNRPSEKFDRWCAWYRQLALIGFNAFLLLVVANLLLAAVYWLKDPKSEAGGTGIQVYDRLGRDAVLRAYPERKPEEVDELLAERTAIQYEYRPYSQFRERARRGRFVNVSEHGYRVIRNQRAWPPDTNHVNVFVFGGSTTFGYGIADDETIPSHLQTELESRSGRPVAVFNFGRANGFSKVELALFQELITARHSIDLAVFVDGLNEFRGDGRRGVPGFTHQLTQLMNAARDGSLQNLPDVPLVRFARSIRRRWEPRAKIETEPLELHSAKHCIDRYLTTKRMIEAVAESFEIQPVFVWQPVPMFEAGEGGNPLARFGYEGKLHIEAYPLLQQRMLTEPFGDEFIWCADLNRKVPSPRYVDKVHYTGKMCAAIAEQIAKNIISRNLLGAESVR